MNETGKSYSGAEVKKLGKSQVEITASVPIEVWEKFRGQALKNLNETVTIDGFRKGNIPENVLVSKVGEMVILEEMAELALPKAYMDILIDHKIDAIGRPQISVTKLAKGNPLEFKAVSAVVPEIKLPDYRKIATEQIKKTSDIDVKVIDKDIEDAILRIRKMHASREGQDLPELNDEFVKKVGKFKDVPEFKARLAEMLAEDKKLAAKEKTRIAIADGIADGTAVELPEIMVQSELNRTQSQFESDIERMGVKLEDYLKQAKKTLEDVRKEWIPHAEKKAKLQLILNEIARLENIKPSPDEIEKEVSHIVEHYKDVDRERASIYAETVLTNEKVFEFLESTGNYETPAN